MTIRVALEHRTTYAFDRPVKVFPHTVRLRPAPHTRTPIEAYSLDVKPAGHFINWQQDAFGNYLARLVFPEPVTELDVTVGVLADMTVINPFDFFVEDYAQSYPFAYPDGLRAELDPYLVPVDGANAVDRWLETNRPADGRIVDFLVELNQNVNRDVAYTVRLEVGVHTPDETLANRLGSCRDSAWLLVAALRKLGLAARFVSGYLVQLTADDPAEGGPEHDFTDLHAWAEVYVPGAGWVGLDATSGLLCGEGHIPLSATPHPSSAAPITGATEPCEVEFSFSNSVTRIHEDPRVTRPYGAKQWAEIDALGTYVDSLLDAADVRLTMGGEPTYVAAGDASAPEWESDADGPQKRERARELAARLRQRWAPEGLVHHGQGKWYPGEPLPRWQIQLSWRADGEPLWRDAGLLDDPWGEPREVARDAVERIARGIARRLGIPEQFLQPAYEDVLHAVWTEASRPVGQPPWDDLDPRDNAGTRARALDEIDSRADQPAGWVVPVFRDVEGGRWATARWRTRRRRLFLTVGTSPIGLRLPLDSIAWEEAPGEPEAAAFAEREDLPARDRLGTEVEPAAVHDIADSPRTALTVEERDGHVFVFLPPIAHLEDALELLAAVENASAEVATPVILEGYPLPGDPRVRTLSVTPDPGVIEVNVQPTASWSEQCDLMLSLDRDARESALATEKFDVDGTHTGTGGGSHITLGGPAPEDSPLLRRPDLLRSLLTYWQHHPALSYVFAGKFIGPTSQSPRVDEGRPETLYELETAFAELERVTAESEASRPWQVDRLLRHLLTDITGNTHRSEFCIDKLYSPDSERGRLGLLEIRGFEMPPHPQMALVQALLVRSLVARFWAEPYAGRLVRWGTRLHDRFLLPAYAAADLREVVADTNRWLTAANPQAPQLDPAWFDPFLEFRFPRLGEADVAGVHLELRQALEPWHVLGEEIGRSGTSRYVDSSVERVQVAARGLIEGRHVVTCNGVPVPMSALDGFPSVARESAASVGGVRYRAWAPPSALHPTIGVHAPLTFDLVDTWSGRSLGGFTYHVVHPGGRSYEDYPVNAVAAESRRAARFERVGHSAGTVDLSRWPSRGTGLDAVGEEYPATLDLRRHPPTPAE